MGPPCSPRVEPARDEMQELPEDGLSSAGLARKLFMLYTITVVKTGKFSPCTCGTEFRGRRGLESVRKRGLSPSPQGDSPLFRTDSYFAGSRVSHCTMWVVTKSAASRCTKCPAVGRVIKVKSLSTH